MSVQTPKRSQLEAKVSPHSDPPIRSTDIARRTRGSTGPTGRNASVLTFQAGARTGTDVVPVPNAGHLTAIRHEADTRPVFERSKFSRFPLCRILSATARLVRHRQQVMQ